MDYFMNKVATGIPDSRIERLSEEDYGRYVWTKKRVRTFLESNLGLSKSKKIKGRIVSGHNESLYFWNELIETKQLNIPFEVFHVDSHADLGLRYDSWQFIYEKLLGLPVEQRNNYSLYKDLHDPKYPRIGDYLLFSIAYRWISKLTYCSNPHDESSGCDYLFITMKNFYEPAYFGEHFTNKIQLLYNPKMQIPKYNIIHRVGYDEYIKSSIAEPEVDFEVFHTIEGVKYDGDFDFVVFAQSPNYTPKSADFIINIIKDYIKEI